MMRLTILAAALSLATGAQANEEAVARYRDYLPQQILNLPEDERKTSVPMMYTGAANLAVAPFGDTVVQAALNSLMYNGLADYEGAKKAFQRDLGNEPTGKLTVGQLHTLMYRSSRLNMPSVSFFPLEYGGHITQDYALVKGTVKIIDEKIAYPINHVKIECFRSDGYCRYRQIVMILPDENSFSNSYSVMDMTNEFYRITRWETDQIDATPAENTACRTNQLSFNFQTKEFYEIARNNTSEECEALGVTLPRLEKPRVSQIVDGSDIIADEFRRREEESRGWYASEFRKRVEAFDKSGDDEAATSE